MPILREVVYVALHFKCAQLILSLCGDLREDQPSYMERARVCLLALATIFGRTASRRLFKEQISTKQLTLDVHIANGETTGSLQRKKTKN